MKKHTKYQLHLIFIQTYPIKELPKITLPHFLPKLLQKIKLSLKISAWDTDLVGTREDTMTLFVPLKEALEILHRRARIEIDHIMIDDFSHLSNPKSGTSDPHPKQEKEIRNHRVCRVFSRKCERRFHRIKIFFGFDTLNRPKKREFIELAFEQ